ncbi:Transcriptional repressor PaaX [Pseudonocardia autotrophica]|uniref:Transcriptional repressor PaaX n=1 Tax=Pseudonocardia autotrophica TaxID=2074 RepID=A0A1Y2N133_PSEAH|nr:Transcriptional repressor PaaX [Pseudonocardia autotrophica]
MQASSYDDSVTVVGEKRPDGLLGAQPRRLIVSLYGLYARERGGWLSVAALVRLMADLGVDGQAVRSAVSRLKRRGLLEPERRDGSAGYRLSEAGGLILAEGDVRIFDRRRADPVDGWLIVVFSVPEAEREKRHQLRAALTRLGLGTVAPGVWIAPAHLESAVTATVDRAGLRGFTEMFRSTQVDGRPLRESVPKWWDLEVLRLQYTEFLDRFRPALARAETGSDRTAFADFVEAVTVWRRLPYLDPGLPLAALPAGWEGVAAESLFEALGDALAAPARRHAMSLVDASAR